MRPCTWRQRAHRVRTDWRKYRATGAYSVQRGRRTQDKSVFPCLNNVQYCIPMSGFGPSRMPCAQPLACMHDIAVRWHLDLKLGGVGGSVGGGLAARAWTELLPWAPSAARSCDDSQVWGDGSWGVCACMSWMHKLFLRPVGCWQPLSCGLMDKGCQCQDRLSCSLGADDGSCACNGLVGAAGLACSMGGT